MKFIYTLNADDDKPIILINKHIGRITNAKGEIEDGIMGEQLQREFLELERLGKTECEAWINSPGGVVSDGWSIYGTIRSLKTLKVTGLNIGIAASTAGWIFEACHERIMMDYAIIMMHNPHGGSGDGQEEYTNSIATMLAGRSGKTNEEVLKLMKRTTFMSADEAYNDGFCDIVRESADSSVKTELVNASADPAEILWNKGNDFLNLIIPSTKNKKMNTETLNLLGLKDDATEAQISDAIKALQAKANEMEDTEEEIETEGEDNAYQDALNDMEKKHKEEMDALNAKFDALKKKNDEADTANTDATCKNMVQGYVNMGRIKADSLDKWVATAKTIGVAEAEALIKDIPLNISAPKIPTEFESLNLAGIKTVTTSVEEWQNEWNEANMAGKTQNGHIK